MLLRALVPLVALALSGCVSDMMEGDPMRDGGADAIDWPDWSVESIRLNHVQMRGTTNSYHDFDSDTFPEVVYRHLALDVQAAEQGIRVFDFDLAPDRRAREALMPRTLEFIVDAESHCGDFLRCMFQLRNWSDATPGHPLTIVLIGESSPGWMVAPELFRQFDDVEGDIDITLGRERVLTPADVRRGFPSLREAIGQIGWPPVESTRGKFLFVLNDRGVNRVDYIVNGGRDPNDRLLFVIGDPDLVDDPALPDEVIFTFEPPRATAFDWEAAWIYESDPAALPRMRALVDAGYLVHAITDDPAFAAELRAAGVHLIGTRFPDLIWPGQVEPVVCNPVTWPEGCDPAVLDPGPD